MMTIKKKAFVIILILCIIAGAVISAFALVTYIRGGLASEYVLVSKDVYNEMKYTSDRYMKLSGIEDLVSERFYKDVDEQTLEEGVYRGLVDALGDKYSRYLTKDEFKQLNEYTLKKFGGIGVIVTSENGYVTVVSVVEGSPAEAAGIKPGDVITRVDGEAYTGDEFTQAAEAMRGNMGTQVKITYVSDGTENTVTITRGEITGTTVYSGIIEGTDVGYIGITSFGIDTDEEFQKQLRELEMRSVSGIVIDLRDNLGGVVESSTNIADMLLPGCVITTLSSRTAEPLVIMSDENEVSIPYALLVNGRSASASEILASAVQDNSGGPVIGTKTYGKGVVQSVIALPDGDALELTTMQYVTPSGKLIQGEGIEPDYIVAEPDDSETDPQLDKAIELLTDGIDDKI